MYIYTRHNNCSSKLDSYQQIYQVSEKFGYPFSHYFIFGSMIPESRGFVAMSVTSCITDTCSNLSLSNYSEGRRNCSTL